MSTKKIFFILLLSLTTNIYSQSNEVKELQNEIDTWKKYPFIQYVYDMDSNQIIVQNKNTGIISGVYSKWSSYSNSRYYEYIITPYDRNGNYSSTETKGITITSSYSKESHEKYIENRIEEIFQKIDSQLEIEKKQNEVQSAINEKNRKRKNHVDDQIKIIEHLKDSLLKEVPNHFDTFFSWTKRMKEINNEIELEKSDFFESISKSKIPFDFLSFVESVNINKVNSIDLFDYSIKENDQILDILWGKYQHTTNDDTNWYKMYGYTRNYESKPLSNNTNEIYNLLNLLNENEIASDYKNLFRFYFLTQEGIWDDVEKRLLFFYNAKTFQNKINTWSKKEIYDAEKNGYDFVLGFPEDYFSLISNERNYNSSLINSVIETGLINNVGEYENKIIDSFEKIENFIENITVISEISSWILKFKSETNAYGWNGPPAGFQKSKAKKILKKIDENLSEKEKKDFNDFIKIFLDDFYEIKNFEKPSSIIEFKSKLIKVETLIDSESKFPTKSLQNCWL